jgi:hypothetical protein
MPRKKANKEILPPHDPDASYSVAAFCRAEQIGKSLYYSMRRLGVGPVEYCPPGTKTVRISPEARREYHRRTQVTPENEEENKVRAALREKSVRAAKLSVAARRAAHRVRRS